MVDGLLVPREAHIEVRLLYNQHPCQLLHQATCCDGEEMRVDIAHRYHGR